MPRVQNVDDPTEGWHPARLIPTVGIKGREDQEKRATSALLAVMHAVPEFAHALLKELGAPKSNVVKTFTEVRFKTADGQTVIPDGALVCERGKTRWSCLVEVKTAGAALRPDQVSAYLDVARDNGFDAVLTISNQITANSTESPVDVDGRKLRKVALRHFSWWRIITEAVVQSRYRGVSDPDQAWILDELIAYLQHPAAGASGFEDMGDKWVAVRKAAHDETLRATDVNAAEVAERWEQFVQHLCLGFSQELGHSVRPVVPRNQTTKQRVTQLTKDLAEYGTLEATLRVPGAVGDLDVVADLRARKTTNSVTFDAPKEMRAKPRLNWLLRQLSDADPGLRIEVHYPNARETTGALLGAARDNVDVLLYPPDAKREPKAFTLTMMRPMGSKRGRAEGSFVAETTSQAFDFYGDLVQDLKAWTPRAPKLREEDREPEPVPVPVTADVTAKPPADGVALSAAG